MFWKSNKKTDDKKNKNNGKSNGNGNESNDIGILVRQDPRTKVKTTSAATETTNTSVQNATIINSNTNTVTFRSTQQTVTHTQKAGVTEIVTRRTPTEKELRELLAQINVGGSSSSSSGGGGGGSNDEAGNASKAKAPTTRPSHLNGVALRHTTSFKRNTASPLSPLVFKYDSPLDDAKRSSTVVKVEQTTVTQKNGRSVTQHVEEHRIKLKPSTKTFGGGATGGKFKSKTTTTTTTKSNNDNNFDTRFKFNWLRTPTGTQISTLNGGGLSYSDARPASITSAKLNFLAAPGIATTTTTTSTYNSPYAKRSIGGGTVYTSALPSITPSSGSNISISSNTRSPNVGYALPNLRPTLTPTPTPSSSTSSIFSNSSATKSPLNPSFPLISNSTAITKPKTPTSNAMTSFNKKQNKLKPGYVYIFNHEKFDDPRNEFRVGSTADVDALNDAFKYFKCRVEVIKNATVDRITKTIAKIESKDYSDASCLTIVILSHGTRHEFIAAKDGDYSIDDKMLFPIIRNRTLNNKPKFFFVQACKGSMEVGKFHKDAVQPSGAPNEIFKCYSTFEGYASYRTDEGSIFIQALCEQLKRYGHSRDIRDIMSDVTKAVRQQSQDKQIPTTTSNLTKGYIFGDYV